MNELGMTLAWLAVQVALLGLPSLALHALATRRGPASGAWVAGMSLGLVVVLSVSAVVTGRGRGGRMVAEGGENPASAHAPGVGSGASPAEIARVGVPERAVPSAGHGWGVWRLRLAWARLERGTAEPAARFRPWGHLLAFAALAGTGVSLLRLATGLCAVRAWRRNGRAIDDPAMIGLFDELRRAMGCPSQIALREVTDLTTPATAGWWRPTVLLPEGWTSWSDPERRAVLAHEIAHIIRGDYAVGLLARLAVALNYWHPVVRWIAGRLQLQQEQAADALGARFAGGRASYVVALSRLALKQDGRSPCWPAREFLPGRGTLIRRIAMLRDRQETRPLDRPLSRSWRLLTTSTLLGLTAGVTALRNPARGGEGEISPGAVARASATASRAANTPIVPPYVDGGKPGFVAFRPAATFRHIDSGLIIPLIMESVAIDFSELAKEHKAIASKPGSVKLGVEDIEWVTCGISFGRVKNSERDDLHSFMLGGLTVRTAAPFDWLAFLRQWRFGFDEVHKNGRAYYKLKGRLKEALGPNACICLLDDRTAVFDDEKEILTFLGRESSQTPSYLRSPDWELASRGLLAVAFTNEGGALAKQYDLKRKDDAVFLSLFQDVDHWTIGLDDAESIALHAAAACRAGEASAAIAGVVESLLKLAREGMKQPDTKELAVEAHGRAYRMIKTLLANCRVEQTDRSVGLRTDGFGTLAELSSIIKAESDESKSRDQVKADKPKGSSR